MAATKSSQKTSRFVERSPLIAFVALVMLVLAGAFSLINKQTLVEQTVAVLPGTSASLDPIELNPKWIGALRVDVTASIPTNRWVTYEVQLLDTENNPIGSAVKQAWRESGTWQEDGESGSWQEQDLKGGIDIRSNTRQTEPIIIAISVLNYGNTAGLEVSEAVTFRVTAQDGAIDGRYLWVGFVAVFLFWILSSMATGKSGKTVAHRFIDDSDAGVRAVMGGANSLIHVRVNTTTDETSPRQFRIDLYIKDGNGEKIYFRRFPLDRRFASKDVYRQTLNVYFLLKQRASYGFYVEVLPDGPVDHTGLIIRENINTRQAVEVITIDNS
ncbi:MAG: hypothetical protein F6K30_15870 [Cyanothece sp. SIO2G6]|nr:hypothetical protein [Cyanothece sp. SIO2G6]